MKLYIVTDVEGVAGVRDWHFAEGKFAREGRRLLSGEVRAAVQGARRAGATRITLFEGHAGASLGAVGGSGVVRVSPRGARWPFGLDRSYDALLFVGQHAMAGAPGGHLCHTMSGAVRAMRINGVVVGEIGVWIILAGTFGVPAIFLSGDRAACREARKLVSSIETVPVKKGLGAGDAEHLQPVEAQTRIRAGVIRAIERLRVEPPDPCVVRPPYVVDESFLADRIVRETNEVADRQGRGIVRIDRTTVRMTAGSLAGALNLRRNVKRWRTTEPIVPRQRNACRGSKIRGGKEIF
jgi:D-amino peptidase